MLRHSQSATQSSLRTMPGSEQEYLNNLEDIEYPMSQLYCDLQSSLASRQPAPDPTLDFSHKHLAWCKDELH